MKRRRDQRCVVVSVTIPGTSRAVSCLWKLLPRAGQGIQWRRCPRISHWRTIYGYASGWEETGATEDMHDELRRQRRIAAGRDPEPTGAIIDSRAPTLKSGRNAGRGR